jgi:hypothetical protein
MTNEIEKWEYRAETFGGFWKGIKMEDVQEILNQWGEQGWEVVSATGFEHYNNIHVIAKRPLTRETIRKRSMPQFN